MLANYVDKYKDLTTRIHHLEKLYDRDIRLIVVSKTQNPEKIITLNNLGQTDFGENYVDEAYVLLRIKYHSPGYSYTMALRAKISDSGQDFDDQIFRIFDTFEE